MNAPRWFPLFVAAIGLNALAVLVSSVWYISSADAQTPATAANATSLLSEDSLTPTPPASQSPAVTKPTSPVPSKPVPSKPEHTTPEPSSTPAPPPATVSDLPLPETLPEVPSLADRQSLESDPIFQEFQNMFSGSPSDSLRLDSLNDAALTTSAGEAKSQEYFEMLDQRLSSATQMTEAARSLAQEAAARAASGQDDLAKRLLKLSTKLRELAAELLVCEL